MADFPADDEGLFSEISQDIRERPEQYRAAGEWLDRNYGPEAVSLREREEREARRKEERREDARRRESKAYRAKRAARWKQEDAARGDKPPTMAYCLALAFRGFLNEMRIGEGPLCAAPTGDDALKCLLLTWLVTDTAADQAGLDLTFFEQWPWSGLHERDKALEEAGDQGGETAIWIHYRKAVLPLWVGYRDGDVEQWLALARKSWEAVRAAGKAEAGGAKLHADALGERADAGKADRPPLSGNERKAFRVIEALPPDTAIGLKELAKETGIDQNVLTSHVIPFLKKHYGVKTRPNVGYHLPESARNAAR